MLRKVIPTNLPSEFHPTNLPVDMIFSANDDRPSRTASEQCTPLCHCIVFVGECSVEWNRNRTLILFDHELLIAIASNKTFPSIGANVLWGATTTLLALLPDLTMRGFRVSTHTAQNWSSAKDTRRANTMRPGIECENNDDKHFRCTRNTRRIIIQEWETNFAFDT